MHKSIATIDSPEFINLQPIDLNPLMSSCEIKVLYIGENRNGSFISKEVATNMAKTLRGAPIVGYYKKEKEDFADHGEKVIIDDEGIKFECMTRPYGFVAPNANIWFQKFNDEDDFGNNIEREYLMTNGYLWTGQYPECANVVSEEGNPQSMELDEKTLQGKWSKNSKTGMEFFIINDAIFSKLCILGEDVEPCFEGANVTAPNISTSFTKMDSEFKNTLYNMMQDLKKLNFALQGGKDMEVIEQANVVSNQQEEPEANFTITVSATSDESNANSIEPKIEIEEEVPKAIEEVEPQEENAEIEEEENFEDKYYALEKEHKDLSDLYTSLQSKYEALEKVNAELVAFKTSIDNEKKDELIKSFYMLSDEDKKDVIENKEHYSLEEIESKLSVICFRKKINFSKEDEVIKEKPAVTFSLEDIDDNTPAWVKAVENTQKNQK